MWKIVVRFGLASGLVLVAISSLMMPLCLSGRVQFERMEVLGYAAMVLAFIVVFFGVRSYRESVGGGEITFGKAFQVGLLMTLITCAMYVLSWEIMYFNFFPDFLQTYSTHVMSQLKERGASEQEVAKVSEQMAFMAKHYDNVFFNSAITFMEIFPVGLVVTGVSAAILRKRR